MYINNYERLLVAEGISTSRSGDLAEALEHLHSAICKLDYENRDKFFAVHLYERLHYFAVVEELHDVVPARLLKEAIEA